MRKKIAIKIQNLMPTLLRLFVDNNETVRRMECNVLTDQILSLICEEIEKVENPFQPATVSPFTHQLELLAPDCKYPYGWLVFIPSAGFENFRQKILALLKED